MHSRIVIAGLFVCLLLGCGKKIAKNTGSSDTPPPNQQTASNDKGKPADKNKKDGDKPNWLNDPRYKKDKDNNEGSGGGGEAGGLPGKPGLGMNISQPPGGWASGTGPGAGASGTPSSGGTTAANTSTKPVSEADLKAIWVFIDSRSGATDKMPSILDIQTALVSSRSHAAELVKDGSIVLTGARMREAVWAYEKRALTQGGWVASQNGVENLTAAELTSRLAGR